MSEIVFSMSLNTLYLCKLGTFFIG